MNRLKTLPLSIVMIGATGAVGTEVVRRLTTMGNLKKASLLGRRPLVGFDNHAWIEQHTVDVLGPDPYKGLLAGHNVAICTLGVGEPSKISKEDFVKIDKDAALRFATACRKAGVQHFQLLSSVGVSEDSRSFYLKTKGELEAGLKALQFERLSLFHPSMILTPTNRYGLSQAVVLKTWPIVSPLFLGPLARFRGIRVEDLGSAIALNSQSDHQGVEILTWADISAKSQPAK